MDDIFPGLLISQCRQESLQLLRCNSTAAGISAASPQPEAIARGYDRVFARDAAICALGMVLTGEPELQEAAIAGLRTVAIHQATNGQMPKYVAADPGEGDFWYVGCVDSTLWWLLARRFAADHCAEGKHFAAESEDQAARAIAWLRCQEHPRNQLLQQNEASDWADIMPRSGYVLYTNALWYRVKILYGLEGAQETRTHFNQLFFPFRGQLAEYRRLRLMQHLVRRRATERELYLSYVNLGEWGDEGDVFGNLLAVLFGLADDELAEKILRRIDRRHLDAPYPVRAVCSPIGREDRRWRIYMDRHRQNTEWQYHNGGIWPFVGGFWVVALAARGRHARAREELARLAAANAAGDWGFYEWHHGRSGEPRGMRGQSWNAAMFLLAAQALERRVF